MRKVVAAVVVGVMLVGAGGAGGQTPVNPPASTCEVLKGQWRDAEMGLAEAYADGITDNSVPRATMRAAESGNHLASANILLTLMTANKCPLPKRAPSHLNYATDALKCATEKVRGNYRAAECQRTNWTPMFKD